jgi:hypothetical protein
MISSLIVLPFAIAVIMLGAISTVIWWIRKMFRKMMDG